MKFNWGHGIALFYSTFVLAFVFIVIKSTTLDNSLVVDNYYEKDIQYQSHMNKLNNTNSLSKDLVITQEQELEYVRFEFPEEMAEVKGEILFYRPSDSSQDFKVKIKTNEKNELLIETKDLKPGLWQVQVDWKSDLKSFYKETSIFI